MLLKRKRTLEEEKRIFNSQWELDYFMIETPAHTNHVVKNIKGDKANQNFCCYTSHAYAKWKGEPRKICAENLKKSVQQQTSCISTFIGVGSGGSGGHWPPCLSKCTDFATKFGEFLIFRAV